ncbi:MAG: rod shape-determining protein RodA [Deltaproteobacteria bacterium RIFCSPLOWO2_12_FULL_60_16]|nr:MAG: rod shape-determining protein RodA [Deltaproteobacteria bacterium RIFCSPLOWO2_12_FULL_60_16]
MATRDRRGVQERYVQIDRRLASHFDWTLFGIVLSLTLLGILTIYSATYSITEGQAGGLAAKQFYWLVVGLAAMLAALSIDYHHLDRLAYPFYGLVLFLLLLVLFIGSVGGGSQRWLNLGFFILQPSEPAKLAVVLALAKYLQYDEPPDGYRLRDLWLPFLLVAPLILLTLVQPDLGTAIILSLIFMSIMLMGGLRLRSFLYLAAAGVVFMPIAWHFLKPYQQKRILIFLNPDLDPLGAGYHVIQSKIAVGSGRFFGKGYLKGTQNQLDFLPAQHTDFVFSVFAEEWGLAGCVLLLALYFAFLVVSLRVVARAKDRFGALLVFGILAIFFWQVLINASMVTGLLPVVGIPLPLLSYGGSSMVSMMVGAGFLINVSMRRFTF